jgi:hypothetical protein
VGDSKIINVQGRADHIPRVFLSVYPEIRALTETLIDQTDFRAKSRHVGFCPVVSRFG